MTSNNPHRLDVAATPEIDPVVRPPDAEPSSSAPVIAAGNVVPFARPRREAAASEAAPALAVDASARPAPDFPAPDRHRLIAGLFAVSLMAHGGLYFVFGSEPEPMASIGLEAISVEIVLGANAPAGPAANPGEDTVQRAPAPDPDAKPAEKDTEEAKPEQTAETRPEPPEEPKPEQTAEAPVQDVEPPVEPETPPEPKPQQVAALPAEPMPAASAPELTVAPEPPPLPEPAKPEAAKPEEVKPEAVKPEIVPPPAKPEPPPKPVQKREPKAKPEPRTRTASIDPEQATGPRSRAAGGVGVGRSQNDANYPGLVRAHLARYQRDIHEQGRAVVSFAIDGGGRVTRVSLVQASGAAGVDQEAQSAVRRASPFPAPPGGRSMSFTVPVNFRSR